VPGSPAQRPNRSLSPSRVVVLLAERPRSGRPATRRRTDATGRRGEDKEEPLEPPSTPIHSPVLSLARLTSSLLSRSRAERRRRHFPVERALTGGPVFAGDVKVVRRGRLPRLVAVGGAGGLPLGGSASSSTSGHRRRYFVSGHPTSSPSRF
jgi:hypothetical protein